MITNEMTMKLIELYNPNNIFNPRRKYVKVIVDSLIEQLANKYMGSVPRGIMNIRRQLNITLLSVEGKDKEILLAMKLILLKYDDVFAKSYTDYEDIYNEFIDIELRNLVTILVNGKFFSDKKLAADLGGII